MNTLEQIAGLKLRLRTLPDELNLAREAAAKLAAEVKERRTEVAEIEAEVVAMARAELLQGTGKRPSEAALTAGVKVMVEKHAVVKQSRESCRSLELRRDAAELAVKHLTDRFLGLQIYADLTACEVRLLTTGLGA